MEKEKYKKFKIALAIQEETITSFAKKEKVTPAAIIRTIQGKSTSKNLSMKIDNFITNTLPKDLK